MAAHFRPSPLLPTPAATVQLQELLRTHAQPPEHLPSTISALSDELARHDEEVSRCEKELARLHAHIRSVESDRAALKVHFDSCCSLLSPVRRLPSELLVEIFALCNISFAPVFEKVDIDSASLEIEMSRLAHSSLLTVSQVCARWHSITMGTSVLWSNLQLDSVLWQTPEIREKATSLLRAALDRGGKSLLDLEVTIEDNVPPEAAVDLLIAHSDRWQSVSITCEGDAMPRLSAAKGRLPHLECLRLLGTPSDLDIFADAPSLYEVDFGGEPETVPSLMELPLKQLRALRCDEYLGFGELMGVGVCPAMALMPLLSRKGVYTLRLSLMEDFEALINAVSLPPVTSDIAVFSITAADGFSRPNAGPAIAQIVESVTLPGLEVLEMESEDYPQLVLPWPHTQFLAMSTRSAFPTHLRNLRLYHSIITETELFQCLSDLPALEHLAISDHQRVGDAGVDHLLLTDTLFRRLTQTPESGCLVPRLRALEFQSLLRFDDSVYLAFLLSRLEQVSPFEAEIWWFPGHFREMDPVVAEAIGTLRSRRQLLFTFAETPPAEE